MLDSIEGAVKSLNEYVERQALSSVVITFENNLYTMRVGGEVEFQTQRFADMATHIDKLVIYLRFLP